MRTSRLVSATSHLLSSTPIAAASTSPTSSPPSPGPGENYRVDSEGACEDVASAVRLVRVFASSPSESVDVALRINMDPRRSALRGVASLPHATGKAEVIGVFADGEDAAAARAAGADIVGADDLVAAVEADDIAFTRALASPGMVPMLGRVARKLGPRGLMPNAKRGTVAAGDDLAELVQALKLPSVDFRADRFGLVHAGIGNVAMSQQELEENINAFVKAIFDAKPVLNKKGRLLVSATLASTHGPGVPINVNAVDPNAVDTWNRKLLLKYGDL